MDTLWKAPQANFLVLYGRRRIGKTSLLTHWINQTGHKALYWVAEPTTPAKQLRSFSQALYTFANPRISLPSDDFSYASWRRAFEEIADIAERQRIALFLDEFTYLLDAEPGIAGILQNAWDHLLKDRNIFLAISGSHLGMMERNVLSYQAPLYGRATAQIHLQPLSFGFTKDFFPNYHPDERMVVYALFGGVPAYWLIFDPEQSISANIRRLLTHSLMRGEPRLLLHDFISSPNNYIGLLQAIANGAHTQKEMIAYTGLHQGHVSQYLSILIDADVVEKWIPVTASPRSRQARYHIGDPYLRFYYRFISNHQSQLDLGVDAQTIAEIKRHLVDFIGKHTWEEICREWVLRTSAEGQLPFLVDQVGSLWRHKKYQIDVAGINTREKTLLLGECKWMQTAAGRGTLSALLEKTALAVPTHGKWQVMLMGFSRRGWTQPAKDFAEEIVNQSAEDANWQIITTQLTDLGQIDKDFVRWATS
jgi:AAA+ ATPase superfamily predicted ATPase